MKKRIVVLSLGGSQIIPNEVDIKYLEKFRKTILKNTVKYKFIIVCGGGSIARKYISALREAGMNEKFQSFAGISATRMNARFMSYFFRQDQDRGIPHKIRELKRYVKRFDVVFCGALEYRPNQTSDSTAAHIAKIFRTNFINLSDVKGLYDKNPKKYKDAKFISKISWQDFDKMANKEKFKPGQHFVLDQSASRVIMKNKIKTYLLGEDMKQLDAVLHNKNFKGTIIGDF